MEKCRTCMLRYECAGMHQFSCELHNDMYYVPDSDAIAEVEEELRECKAVASDKKLQWKKGSVPLPIEIKRDQLRCSVDRELIGVGDKGPDAPSEYDRYKEAIDRLGKFGELFVQYSGCPRGAVGRLGNATLQEEAVMMDVVIDVDGGRWRPVNEDVLQELLSHVTEV